jgi:hypothetical protein
MATQLLLIAIFLLGAPGAVSAEHYHGRVVEAETGRPLAGAVVVVVWLKDALIRMDGGTTFHEAMEGLTDGDGRFFVPATSARTWNPFTFVRKEPEILIFKPMYGEWPTAYGRRDGGGAQGSPAEVRTHSAERYTGLVQAWAPSSWVTRIQ